MNSIMPLGSKLTFDIVDKLLNIRKVRVATKARFEKNVLCLSMTRKAFVKSKPNIKHALYSSNSLVEKGYQKFKREVNIK